MNNIHKYDTLHTIEVDPNQTIKKRFIQFFIITFLIVATGSFLALHQLWKLQEEETRTDLERSVALAINLIESSILIASKSVDIGVENLNDVVHEGYIADRQSHDILKLAVDNFNFQDNASKFGLLFHVDKNGIIRAENKTFPAAHIDVSERLYFKELSKNKSKKFAIGNLVVGKTNKKITFHFAESLKTNNEAFNGLLMEQIDAEKLITSLEKVIKNTNATIYVQSTTNCILFAYPHDLLHYFITPKDNEYVTSGKLDPNATPIEIIDIFSGNISSSFDYQATSNSIYFGLTAYARLNFKSFVYDFVKNQIYILLYIFIGLFLLAFIFYSFYKNAIELKISNFSADHDELTGLFNRRYLDSTLPLLWRNAKREKSKISALFIDIDHFKIFNDVYGHERGDIALNSIANTIKDCTGRPLDICCRWGGEEFVVILCDTNLNDALLLANKILDKVRGINFEFPGYQHPKISVSIGIACTTVTDKNISDDLVDMADKAMYKAKQNGRDKYEIYEE